VSKCENYTSSAVYNQLDTFLSCKLQRIAVGGCWRLASSDTDTSVPAGTPHSRHDATMGSVFNYMQFTWFTQANVTLHVTSCLDSVKTRTERRNL